MPITVARISLSVDKNDSLYRDLTDNIVIWMEFLNNVLWVLNKSSTYEQMKHYRIYYINWNEQGKHTVYRLSKTLNWEVEALSFY